jgi:hypothetical protein
MIRICRLCCRLLSPSVAGRTCREWRWRRHVARLSRRRRAAAYSGPVMSTTATPPFTCHLFQSIQAAAAGVSSTVDAHALKLLGLLRLTLAFNCSGIDDSPHGARPVFAPEVPPQTPDASRSSGRRKRLLRWVVSCLIILALALVMSLPSRVRWPMPIRIPAEQLGRRQRPWNSTAGTPTQPRRCPHHDPVSRGTAA